MAETPKIQFAEGSLSPSQPAIDLKSLAEEFRLTFSLGIDKGMEIVKMFTQPPPSPPMEVVRGFGEPTVEDEARPGVIDLGSLWQMAPEAREAILARAGLQQYRDTGLLEPDLTHETLREAIKEDGGIPPTEEGE